MTSTRTIYKDAVEYIEVSLTSDITLSSQPVHFSFDRETWVAGEWIGTSGTTRSCRFLLDSETLAVGSHAVYVRVTDDPEIPITWAGVVIVR